MVYDQDVARMLDAVYAYALPDLLRIATGATRPRRVQKRLRTLSPEPETEYRLAKNLMFLVRKWLYDTKMEPRDTTAAHDVTCDVIRRLGDRFSSEFPQVVSDRDNFVGAAWLSYADLCAPADVLRGIFAVRRLVKAGEEGEYANPGTCKADIRQSMVMAAKWSAVVDVSLLMVDDGFPDGQAIREKLKERVDELHDALVQERPTLEEFGIDEPDLFPERKP